MVKKGSLLHLAEFLWLAFWLFVYSISLFTGNAVFPVLFGLYLPSSFFPFLYYPFTFYLCKISISVNISVISNLHIYPSLFSWSKSRTASVIAVGMALAGGLASIGPEVQVGHGTPVGQTIQREVQEKIRGVKMKFEQYIKVTSLIY